MADQFVLHVIRNYLALCGFTKAPFYNQHMWPKGHRSMSMWSIWTDPGQLGGITCLKCRKRAAELRRKIDSATLRWRASPRGTAPLNASIDILALTARTRRAIINFNFVTIGDLVKKSSAELTIIPKFGPASLQELEDALRDIGRNLNVDKVVPPKPGFEVGVEEGYLGTFSWRLPADIAKIAGQITQLRKRNLQMKLEGIIKEHLNMLTMVAWVFMSEAAGDTKKAEGLLNDLGKQASVTGRYVTEQLAGKPPRTRPQ